MSVALDVLAAEILILGRTLDVDAVRFDFELSGLALSLGYDRDRPGELVARTDDDCWIWQLPGSDE